MAKYYYEKGLVSNKFHIELELHREDGPAVVHEDDGYRSWWLHGVLHRLDGPAIDYDGQGCCRWCINGDELTEAEFEAHPERLKYLFGLEFERMLNE